MDHLEMELSSTDPPANYLNYTVSGGVDLSLSGNDSSSSYARDELNLPYAFCEVIVAVCAVIGNGLVIIVFSKDRKLRRRTNYYIISLATADLLVGLFAIPFAILASIGLPTNLYACLFTVSVLVVLCTISIFCLVAVSIDRYWAILHPMGYSRNVRTKTAIGIICVCWIAGTLVGFLPLLGWNAGKKSNNKCMFVEVMDYDYLVFLYFATIIFPALLIAAFYAHIYRVVVKQLRQIVTMNPGRRIDNGTTGTMLRLLGAAQKRDVKATQNLSRIVLFFIICWFPLYTINCVKAFCHDCEVNEIILNSCIILSHLNSVGNPILYAYHLKDFRAALQSFICGSLISSSPTIAKKTELSVITNNQQRGSSRFAGPFRTNPRPQNVGIVNARTTRCDLLRLATDNSAAFTNARVKTNSTKDPTIVEKPQIHREFVTLDKSSAKTGRSNAMNSFSLGQNVTANVGEFCDNDETSSPTISREKTMDFSDIVIETCESTVNLVAEISGNDENNEGDDNGINAYSRSSTDVSLQPEVIGVETRERDAAKCSV